MRLTELLYRIYKPQGLFLVVCCLVLIGCENDLTKLPGNDPLKEMESDKAEEVTILYSEKGKTKTRVSTKTFVGNDKVTPSYIDFLNGVKMELFNDSLQVETTLTARTARYYNKQENVIARDSVVITSKTGDKLETEELIWNQHLGRFYTEKQVKITKDGRVTYGKGLEATQDFSYVRIKEQRGAIPVDDKDIPVTED